MKLSIPFIISIIFTQFLFSEPISFQYKNISKKTKFCTIEGKYPELTASKNISKEQKKGFEKVKSSFKKEIAKFLETQTSYCKESTKEKLEYGSKFDWQVTLINEKLISIYFWSSDYTSGTAHPNNYFQGYNYLLEKGDLLNFKKLWISSKPPKELNKKIVDNLISNTVISEKGEFNPKSKYDFYLTPKSIKFINLFEIHALSSVEVEIPYKELKNFIDSTTLGLPE